MRPEPEESSTEVEAASPVLLGGEPSTGLGSNRPPGFVEGLWRVLSAPAARFITESPWRFAAAHAPRRPGTRGIALAQGMTRPVTQAGYYDSTEPANRVLIDARAGGHPGHRPPRATQVSAMHHPQHPPDLDPVALVNAARTGDKNAFAALYTAYLPVVRRIVYARMRNGDDLVSETFTRAWSRLDSFTWSHATGFPAWLTRIATNLVRDWYGSAHVRRTEPCGDYADIDSADLIDEGDPLELACRNADAELFRSAIRGLTAPQKRCGYLRIYRGLSVEETAQAMGMEQAAVKALMHRGVRALRGRLMTRGGGVRRGG